MLCSFSLTVNIVSSAVLWGIKSFLSSQLSFLLVGGSILHQCGRFFILHSDTGLLTCFIPPILILALPAMTQFSEWHHPSIGSLSASINGHRRCSSALHTCSSGVQQPNHLTCGLHPSSVYNPVDIHNPSCNFPFFHPWEALLVGHWVSTLPFCSCGIITSSPPKEVVVQGVGLVHLYCV